MNMLMEYNGMAIILYLLLHVCPRDCMSQGRHFCHVVEFSLHVVMSVMSHSHTFLSHRRYLLSCGLDFRSHLGV